MSSFEYPKGEIVWVRYYSFGQPTMFITSKASREFYILYEVADGKYKKIGRANSPLELEKKFEVINRLNKQDMI